MGYETGEEELRNLVSLVRTKDGRLAAMVTFNDKEGDLFALLLLRDAKSRVIARSQKQAIILITHNNQVQ